MPGDQRESERRLETARWCEEEIHNMRLEGTRACIAALRTADARIKELEEALEQCAAPFAAGDQDGIAWEELAREFNRRQCIARTALSARSEEE